MKDGTPISKGDLWEEYYANLSQAYHAMRRAFQKSGQSQDDLAAKLNVDKGLISKRLKGIENLTLKTLSFMASAMGCRLEIRYVPYAEVKQAESTHNLANYRETGPSTTSYVVLNAVKCGDVANRPEVQLSQRFSQDAMAA